MWGLLETFEVSTSAGLIRIIKGFQLDFGSIPRFAWGLVGHPLDNDSQVGYLVHDAFYSAKLTTRKQADDLLLELMLAYGTGTIRAHTIWGFVRAFGWVPWNHRKMSSVHAARRYVKLHPFMPVG
jgi:hypothetical protein